VAVVLVAITLGPEFGNWLAAKIHVSKLFIVLWPYVRWILIGAFTVLAIETIYFWGPNVRQRFKDQVPGAIVAVVRWILASWGLGWYVSHFANYIQTFGVLGAVVGLMLWFYVTALALLLGAEMNAELAHSKGKRLREREGEPQANPVQVISPTHENLSKSA